MQQGEENRAVRTAIEAGAIGIIVSLGVASGPAIAGAPQVPEPHHLRQVVQEPD